MKPVIKIALAVLAFVLLTPSPANAAVCADHPNQAAAQRAADTRDADSDGIFCESLPCPCASATPSAPPPPAPARKTCSVGTTRALIAGSVKCLKSGQFCKRAWAPSYRRYGFKCTTLTADGRARLRRR